MKTKKYFNRIIGAVLSCCVAFNSGLTGAFLTNAEAISKKDLQHISKYEETATLTADQKISEKLHEQIDVQNTAIPVVVWYRSFTQDYIEALIEKKLGFSIDEVEQTYVPPSDEMLSALSEASERLSVEYERNGNIENASLNHYFKLQVELNNAINNSARSLEKNRVDKYCEARTEVVQKLYRESYERLLKRIDVSEKDVIFSSDYTPMLICEIPPEKILQVSQLDEVENLYYYESFEPESEDQELNRNGLNPTMAQFHEPLLKKMGVEKNNGDDYRSIFNLYGNGVKVGIYEGDHAYTSNSPYLAENGLINNQISVIGSELNNPGSHATHVCGVIGGRTGYGASGTEPIGIAPQSEMYSVASGSMTNGEWLNNFQTLINAGVKLINCSWGSGTNPGDTTVYLEKHLDSLIKNQKVTMVFAAGNYPDDEILAPAQCYNGITVTAFHPINETLDDVSYQTSGVVKPDVAVASAYSATSSAAPVLTGMIALLYDYKPSLMLFPHLTKAIVLASSHEKLQSLVGGESLDYFMEHGFSNRQGVGIPNFYNMLCIVAQHSYGYGIMNPSVASYHDYKIIQPSYGASNINVSMAFLQRGINNGNPYPIEDYDLRVTSVNNVKISNLSNSAAEMVYLSLPSSINELSIKVEKYSGYTSTALIEYAYAWSTDHTRMKKINIDNEVYYLKNANSNMHLNNNSNQLIQSNNSNSDNQRWIFKYNPANATYTIQNAYGTTKGLAVGASLGTGLYTAINTSPTPKNITVVANDDGTITLKAVIGSNMYALGVLNSSTSNNAQVVWKAYTPYDDSQKWYKCSNVYKVGDSNLNGSINSTDTNSILTIAASIGTGNVNYSNIIMYLSDYNGDGTVNAIDSALLSADLSNNYY